MEDTRVHYGRCLSRYLALIVSFFLTLSAVCSAREKKDVIQFTNGDRITCEIVKLEKGYLYVKLDYADGTVAMDWSKIASVESQQKFVVADSVGERYTGSLQTAIARDSPEQVQVKVSEDSTTQALDSRKVVEIHPIETTFRQNLHIEFQWWW